MNCYRQKENAKWLAMILFIKHFLYEQMEQIKMGKLLSESLLLTYKNETFDVETLIGRYHANIYSENECIQIVEDPVNNPLFGYLLCCDMIFQFRKADRKRSKMVCKRIQMVLCEECNIMSK